MSNRLPRGYAGRFPSRHSKRENKAIQTAVDTVRKNTADNFSCRPLIAASTGAAASTTANAINVIRTDAAQYEMTNKVGTIAMPTWSSTGLNIGACVDTDDDAIELTQGDTARSRSAFTVGTDGPFYFEAEILITDVSGTDDFLVGFRKAEAAQDDTDGYDEMAAFNIVSGDIKTETILNNAATVTTDTTDNWADVATKKLRVDVARDGKVTYKIDGVDPTVSAASTFTFDAGEVVVPFISLLAAADLPESTVLKQWNCGLSK